MEKFAHASKHHNHERKNILRKIEKKEKKNKKHFRNDIVAIDLRLKCQIRGKQFLVYQEKKQIIIPFFVSFFFLQ